MATRIELTVDELLLDLDNPRIGSTESQAKALEALVLLEPNHFRTMMRSIAEHGLDPGDSFYVIQEAERGEGYTVVDGNRRLAALKVLHNPNLLQGTELPEKQIRQLASLSFKPGLATIEPLSCVLFDSRAEADEWIARRHGRGLAGEERIPWNSLQIQRFQKDRTILDLIDFVERNSTLSDEEWYPIKASVEAKPSVLRRLVEARTGREWLGITVKEDEGHKVPMFSRDPKFVLDVLTHIFEDIYSNKINTRSHNKSLDIDNYFYSLPPELHPTNSQERTQALAFRDAEIKDAQNRPRKHLRAATEKRSIRSKTAKIKGPRATLAPTRHNFVQPKTEKGRALVREAARLRLNDTPLAAAFILRGFLEHTLGLYMHENDIPARENGKPLDLSQKAERVLKHLKDSGRASGNDLRGVRRTLTNRDDPASIQALNDYHHAKNDMPSADVLRNAWDTAEALFIAVYGAP